MDRSLIITWETVKEKFRLTAIMAFVFSGLASMYIIIFPYFKDSLEQFKDMPVGFIRGYEELTSFAGFMNMELYQIFWVLILGVLVAYVAGSLISEELEAKTIDMLLSNPVSRTKVVLEKFFGLVPMILIVNFAVMGTVYGLAPIVGESIEFYNLLLTHLVSIPYFLSIVGIGVLVSTFIDKKMKASITAMGIVVAMYVIESLSLLAPEVEDMGLMSIAHYFDPSELLINGELDVLDPIILAIVTAVSLSIAVVHFEERDLEV